MFVRCLWFIFIDVHLTLSTRRASPFKELLRELLVELPAEKVIRQKASVAEARRAASIDLLAFRAGRGSDHGSCVLLEGPRADPIVISVRHPVMGGDAIQHAGAHGVWLRHVGGTSHT